MFEVLTFEKKINNKGGKTPPPGGFPGHAAQRATARERAKQKGETRGYTQLSCLMCIHKVYDFIGESGVCAKEY